jgi:hypothetical protein
MIALLLVLMVLVCLRLSGWNDMAPGAPGVGAVTGALLGSNNTWTGTNTFQNTLTIEDPVTTTKGLTFSMINQSASTLVTFNTGAQTASRTASLPVLTGSDTFAMLGVAQTFTAVNTFSNSQDATALGTGALVLSAGGLSVNNQIRLGGALTGSGTITGTQLVSTIATGTAPFTVTSTTVVPNLNVSQLLGQTWANPGAIGGTTPATTIALSGILTSTNTTSATTSLLGAVVIGNGTAATSIGMGAGNINAGGTLTTGAGITAATAAASIFITATETNTVGTAGFIANGDATGFSTYKYQLAGVNKLQHYFTGTSWTFNDVANNWNPLVYAAGSTVAGVFTYAGTLAANAAATTASVIFSGGVAAVGAFQSQLGFGYGALPQASTPINLAPSSGYTGGLLPVVKNSVAGTGNFAGWQFQADTAIGYVGTFSSTYSTSGVFVANSSGMYGGGAGGLWFAANAGAIAFATGGTTSRGGISSAGIWSTTNTTAATAYNAASFTIGGGLGVNGGIWINSATLLSSSTSLTNAAGAVTIAPPTNAPTGTTRWVYATINNNGTNIYALCASP